MLNIRLKRAYDPPARNDGYRVLVDRVWPRGVTKEALSVNDWFKDLAPSTPLRKWFGHEPAKWTEFQRRYFRELDEHPDLIRNLAGRAKDSGITLVFAARDTEHNNAVALKNYLCRQRR